MQSRIWNNEQTSRSVGLLWARASCLLGLAIITGIAIVDKCSKEVQSINTLDQTSSEHFSTTCGSLKNVSRSRTLWTRFRKPRWLVSCVPLGWAPIAVYASFTSSEVLLATPTNEIVNTGIYTVVMCADPHPGVRRQKRHEPSRHASDIFEIIGMVRSRK